MIRQPQSNWKELMTYDDSRQHVQFMGVFITMAAISGFMTVLNYLTGWRQALMYATLIFSLLNIVNALFEHFEGRKIQKIPRVLFAVEIIVLFTFFVINGQPKGFSTLWTALLPACGLLLYKAGVGSLISGIQFAILVFLFYFPAGQQLLKFEYTDVFMMRFPILYLAFYITGILFELIRHNTQQALKATRDRYKQVNFRIMQVLTDMYKVVVSVDLESGKMEIYSGQDYVLPTHQEMSFYDAIADFSDNKVTDDCREQFKDFFTKESIVKNLKDESSPMLTYSIIMDGETRYFQARVIRIPEESGEIQQFVAAFSDADAYVHEQQQIQQELLTQRIKAKAASKAKTDFLFNMSHDIRTPMNAIIGFTDMAIKEADHPEKVRNVLNKVILSGNMLLSLINDILDMSHIESGKVIITAVPSDMEAIFLNIQSVMADFADSKNIGLSFDVSGIRDRYVYLDKTRVDRILVNLVSNAIKYTASEGKVQVSCEQILSDEKPGYGTFRFSVRDNGIGMSEEFQERMFDEFSREENAMVQGVQGTGLGLPLAKKLTVLMGGSISCESKTGVGSTFTVTLPFKIQEVKSSDAQSSDSHGVDNADVTGKRVLLVEDNELNREITIYILEENGMVVECAVDGSEAVRMVSENGPDHYDFIVMDIQMPVMNGYEASMKIREMYPDSGVPIIALSANAFDEDREKSLASGMNDHVSKPLNIAELLKSFHKFM